MKLIHCGDIHLDSRMESNLPAAKARERNAEVCATFARMVSFAQQQGVEAVLIAGDLFDTGKGTGQTVDFVLNQVRSHPDMDFLYLRGNHDEKTLPQKDLPRNLKTFGSEWTSYSYGDVVVTGVEPDREGWEHVYDTLNLPEDKCNIVMLHGQVSTQPGQEMIALPKLKNRAIDYLALGHIHSFQSGTLDSRGSWNYCGCLEGRGFDECGEKGFVLLHVENRQAKGEFIPFSRRKLHEIPVDITGLTVITQILSAMEEACKDIDQGDLVKFTLTGTFTLETQKDLRFLQKMLEDRFYFVKIKDESHLFLDRESYEHDISLKGEFIRMVLSSDKSVEEKEKIILWGIQALSGEEVTL